jgi:hypothetical protein
VVLEGTPHELASTASSGEHIVTFGARPGLDTAALAEALGTGAVVTEEAPGRYRVENAPGDTASTTAVLATWLAGRGGALTDLATGRSLEDVYFDAVGADAVPEPDADPDAGAPAPAARARRGRGRPRSRRG